MNIKFPSILLHARTDLYFDKFYTSHLHFDRKIDISMSHINKFTLSNLLNSESRGWVIISSPLMMAIWWGRNSKYNSKNTAHKHPCNFLILKDFSCVN